MNDAVFRSILALGDLGRYNGAGSRPMNYEDRKQLLSRIETLRGGRRLICLLHFDRAIDPAVDGLGLSIQFEADAKEALFRVLKETGPEKLDVLVYSRGGDANGVWPLVSIVREFDPDFEVLVPFRCHSSGTLFALGAKRIVMTPLSELSPIDPTTGNHFNPKEGTDKNRFLGISVEDVRAYRSFVLAQFGLDAKDGSDAVNDLLPPFLSRLVQEVHPLALGNVERVHRQIKQLAKNLLELHPVAGRNLDEIIESLTTRFWSHLHMINRHEAKMILGDEQVQFADRDLEAALDDLLRTYENHFNLRQTLFLNAFLGDKPEHRARFIGGVLESTAWGYLFETCAILRQFTAMPSGVQVQVPAGQPMPLIQGLPRSIQVEVQSRGWIRNKEPKGFDK